MNISTDLFEDSETEDESSVPPQVPHTTSSNASGKDEHNRLPSIRAECTDPDLTDEEDIYNMPTQPVVITSTYKRRLESLFGSEPDVKSPSSSQETVICETPAKKSKSPSFSQETVIGETPAKTLRPEHGHRLLQIPVQVPFVSTPIKSNSTAIENDLSRTPMLALCNPSQAFGWDTPTQRNPDVSSAGQFIIAESNSSVSDAESEDAYLLPTQPNPDIHSYNTQEKLTLNNRTVGETKSRIESNDDSSSDTVLSIERDSLELFNLPTQANSFNGNVSNVQIETENSYKEVTKPTSEAVAWDLIPTQQNPQFHNKQNTSLERDSGSETELEDNAMELTQPFNIFEIATQLNPRSNYHAYSDPPPRASIESNVNKIVLENQPRSSPEMLEFTLVYSESEESEAEQRESFNTGCTKDQLQSRAESPRHSKSSTRVESDSDTDWEDETEAQLVKPVTLFDQPTQANPLVHAAADAVSPKSKISGKNLPDTEPVQVPNVVAQTLLRQEAVQDDLVPTEPIPHLPTSNSPLSVGLSLNPQERTALHSTESQNEIPTTTVSVTGPQKSTSQEEIRMLSELETQVWDLSPQKGVTESSTQVCTVANPRANSVKNKTGKFSSETVITEAATQIWDLPTQPNPQGLRDSSTKNGIIPSNGGGNDEARTVISNKTIEKSKTPSRATTELKSSYSKNKSALLEAETQIWELPTQPNPQFLDLNETNAINSSDKDCESKIPTFKETSQNSKASQRKPIAPLALSGSEEEITPMEVETQIWNLPTQPNPEFLAKLNEENSINSNQSKAKVTSSKIVEKRKTPKKGPEAMLSCPEEGITSETQIWDLPTQPNAEFLAKQSGTNKVNSSDHDANGFTSNKTPEKSNTPQKRLIGAISHSRNEIASVEAETQIWELPTQPNSQVLAKSNEQNEENSSDSDHETANETKNKSTLRKRSVVEPKVSNSDGTEEDSAASKKNSVTNGGYLSSRSRNVIRRSEVHVAENQIAENSTRVTDNIYRNSGADSPDVFSLSQLMLPDSEDLTPPSSDNTTKNIAKTDTKKRENKTAANAHDSSDDDATPLLSQNIPMYGFPREDAGSTPAHTDLKLIQCALNQPNTPKRTSAVLQNGIPETGAVKKSPEAKSLQSALENNNGPTPSKKPRISTRKGRRSQDDGVNSKIPSKRNLRVDLPQQDHREEKQAEQRKSREKAKAIESRSTSDASHTSIEETPNTSRKINLKPKDSTLAKAVTRVSLAADTVADLQLRKIEPPKRGRGRPKKVAVQPKVAKTENTVPPTDRICVHELAPKSEPEPRTSADANMVLFSPKLTRGKKKSLIDVKEPKHVAKVMDMKIDKTGLKMTLATESRRTTRTKATESVQVNKHVSAVARSKRDKAVKNLQIKQEPEDSCEGTRSDEPRTRRARETIEVKEESTGASKWNFRERRNCAFRVLFTGIDEPDDKELVDSLGGVVVERVEDCQVLVTDKVRRTVKFLCAVGAGKLIVSHLWLCECRIRRKFVDPEPFLLKDKQGEKTHNFQLELSVAKAKERPLLKEWEFFLTPSILPPPAEMSEIIKSSGGRAVSSFRSANKEQAAVISVKADENLWPTYKNFGIPILSTEAILTGVLRQCFETKPYILHENKR